MSPRVIEQLRREVEYRHAELMRALTDQEREDAEEAFDIAYDLLETALLFK